MPAASIDDGPWQVESTDILCDLGFNSISDEETRWLSDAWRGVFHRTDHPLLFWGGFSLAGDRHPKRAKRLRRNMLRSFITWYFFVLIRFRVWKVGFSDPDNFGDQFLPFEQKLKELGQPFLSGSAPSSLDFLLFGVIQCHSSVYVPTLTALQNDSRLTMLRGWIGRMHERMADYSRLYSGPYFAPYAPPPTPVSGLDQAAFWLGSALLLGLFPITLGLIVFGAVRARI